MTYLANHDALTGLPNRSQRTSPGHRSRSTLRSSEVGLLWLDLDHFKDVIDSYGHAVGDALLCSVAARLSSVLGERHLLARVGGDQFVVLCCQGNCGVGAGGSDLRADPDKRQEIAVALSIGLAVYPAERSVGRRKAQTTWIQLEILRRTVDDSHIDLREALGNRRGKVGEAVEDKAHAVSERPQEFALLGRMSIRANDRDILAGDFVGVANGTVGRRPILTPRHELCHRSEVADW